jgi:uncharacterized protein (DUF58 family)
VTGEDRRAELAEILEEVRRIDVRSRRLVADLAAGGYSTVFRGAGIEFDGVREYAEGDDPRSVDWNVTARTGRPFVKKYVDERELTVLFALDLSASMDAGSGALSPRRVAARVCACLALSAARSGDRVGLLAAGAGPDAWVPPGKGAAHALRVVRDCLALPSRAGAADLAPALEFVRRAIRRRAVLFLLSDFLVDGWRDALARCARRHDLVAVRLLGPELDLPAGGGLLRVRDPEGGGEVVIDAGHGPTREAWAARVARWRARTEEDLRRARVDLVDVPIPRTREADAVSGPLLRFFRMREQRGAKR